MAMTMCCCSRSGIGPSLTCPTSFGTARRISNRVWGWSFQDIMSDCAPEMSSMHELIFPAETLKKPKIPTSCSRWGLRAAVLASTRARFVDGDPGQPGQREPKALPNPFGQDFACWIFQTGDLIQMAVIQLVEDRGKSLGDVREITHPPLDGVDGTGDVDDDTERVSVQPRALVAGR